MRNFKFGNLLLVIFSTLLTLCGLELGARFYLWNIAPEDRFVYYASPNQMKDRYGDNYLETNALYVPHRYIGYVPNPVYDATPNRHNALGFRGDEITVPKPDNVFRIVCIGGSTTYGTSVDNYINSYPYKLQEELHSLGYEHVEVVNAGAGNYTTLESLINFQTRVLPIEPDMIIIYHGINDIHQRIVHPPEAFKGDYSGSRSLRVDNLQWPHPIEYSTVARFLLIRAGILQSMNDLDFTLIELPDTSYFRKFLNQKERGVYPQDIFTEVSVADMLATNPPIYFEENIRSMLTIAQANDIQPMLMTFAYSSLFEDEVMVSAEEYTTALDEHNAVITSIAQDMDIPLFDLYTAMPDERRYYDDGRHFTREGNEFRAELIADFIADNALIPD